MSQTRPLAAKEATAAAMLDMSVAEFRRLVAQGALPPPLPIGGKQRWRTADLEAIISGYAARPSDEDFSM